MKSERKDERGKVNKERTLRNENDDSSMCHSPTFAGAYNPPAYAFPKS